MISKLRLIALFSLLLITPLAAEMKSNCGTPLPFSRGTGTVPGVPIGSGRVYWAKDALVTGFNWFPVYNTYFPNLMGQVGSVAPGGLVLNMAYSNQGAMQFDNVVVPANGTYQITFRYAFAEGFFPTVMNRQMGLMVDGLVVDPAMNFWITGNFARFCHSWVNVALTCGRHEIKLFNLTNHGVSRVDDMDVSPSTGLPPPLTASLCNGAP